MFAPGEAFWIAQTIRDSRQGRVLVSWYNSSEKKPKTEFLPSKLHDLIDIDSIICHVIASVSNDGVCVIRGLDSDVITSAIQKRYYNTYYSNTPIFPFKWHDNSCWLDSMLSCIRYCVPASFFFKLGNNVPDDDSKYIWQWFISAFEAETQPQLKQVQREGLEICKSLCTSYIEKSRFGLDVFIDTIFKKIAENEYGRELLNEYFGFKTIGMLVCSVCSRENTLEYITHMLYPKRYSTQSFTSRYCHKACRSCRNPLLIPCEICAPKIAIIFIDVFDYNIQRLHHAFVSDYVKFDLVGVIKLCKVGSHFTAFIKRGKEWKLANDLAVEVRTITPEEDMIQLSEDSFSALFYRTRRT